MTLDVRLSTLVEAGRKKKAMRIQLLDVRQVADFTDIFAFLSGGSDRQNRAIADSIRECMRAEYGESVISSEGEGQGRWILLDYGDIIVHIMDEETRGHYRLEELWKKGQSLELPPEEIPERPVGATV